MTWALPLVHLPSFGAIVIFGLGVPSGVVAVGVVCESAASLFVVVPPPVTLVASSVVGPVVVIRLSVV